MITVRVKSSSFNAGLTFLILELTSLNVCCKLEETTWSACPDLQYSGSRVAKQQTADQLGRMKAGPYSHRKRTAPESIWNWTKIASKSGSGSGCFSVWTKGGNELWFV
ncbi:hypothetical protein CHARACLAT_005642 [Characodon lateralis]|uniref:Secreted protein n=1 Tax=Characodon lateralis TaxID=208331 RepID=A0ABU7CYI0_9TELE|nr:hypothetical protein [Characodon lateralis]